MKKPKLSNFYIALTLSMLFVFIYFTNPVSLQNFNNNFIDTYFNLRPDANASKDIIILDIDERSLAKLGHWPWRRDKIAQIIDNLTSLNVGLIGFDMIFAEEDYSSPKKVAKEYNLSIENAQDYDEIFAKSINNSPSILGYILNIEQNYTINPPNINAVFIEKNRTDQKSIIQARGVTGNIPILQNAAYSSGSFNMIPDADGVVRMVPLLYQYDQSIYPSLSLEITRAILGESVITINYNEYGIENIQIGELVIPTDENGRIFINFAGAKHSYKYISALDIYNNKIKKEQIEGKIVLIGTSASGLMDLRATPHDKAIAGVEIHANVIDNILNQNFLQKPYNARGIDALVIFASTIGVAIILSLFSSFTSLILSIVYLTLFHYGLFYIMFQEGIILNIIYPTLSILSTILGLFFSNLFYESKQKNRILGKFEKKVSPAVAQTLIKSTDINFATQEKEVSIFFSDIRSFTNISEKFRSAHKLIEYLNDYMSPMSEIIIKNGGTIDKYIGDAIMAYWNAPLNVKNHADKAVSSALEQIRVLENLNKSLLSRSLPEIKIGIGIHTGEVIVGEMGSKDRSDYTIIGDSVNLCSRVEGLCKIYGVSILITEQTKNRLKNSYKIREIDSVTVKGKEEAVRLYEVLDFGNFNKNELKKEQEYIKALNLYKECNYEKALTIFQSLKTDMNNKIFEIYYQRCKKFIKEGIRLDNAIFQHHEK